MTKSVMADYIDELIEIVQRMDYIIGQYEKEDADACRPMRKIGNSMMSHVASLQKQVWDD